MNIGLFTDTYHPQINGVATSVLMLKERLEAMGHNAYVFTTSDPAAPESEHNVYRLPSMPFASERRIGLLFHPGVAMQILRLRLDLIHTHTEFSLGIFGRAMAKALGIPVVHTMHTIYEDYTHYVVKTGMLDPMAKTAAKKLTQYFCNSADRVIVPTVKVEKMLQDYGVDAKAAVIPTGISLEKFAPQQYDAETVTALRREYGIKETDRTLLYIGRISEEKNIAELIRGLASYLPSHPDTKFLIVGDGPELCKLRTLTGELGIAGQVIFAGAKPWADIGLYYQLGDAFLSASQSETQGLTYIEALAAGLALIVKDDRCLDAVLREGENGFSFRDTDGFHRAIDAVFADEALRKKLSRSALETAQSFSAETFGETVAKLYAAVLAEHGFYAHAS